MNEKTCLLCIYFYFRGGQPSSDETPGFDVNMGCRKKYWQLKPLEDTQGDYRRKMLSAKDCHDFKKSMIFQ